MSAAEAPAFVAVAVGILLACIGLAFRAVWQRRRHPPAPLVAPVGRDVTHGAPARPVPPVMPPPDSPAHYQQVAGIWGPDILEIKHTIRQYPYVDWQGKIRERRN